MCVCGGGTIRDGAGEEEGEEGEGEKNSYFRLDDKKAIYWPIYGNHYFLSHNYNIVCILSTV